MFLNPHASESNVILWHASSSLENPRHIYGVLQVVPAFLRKKLLLLPDNHLSLPSLPKHNTQLCSYLRDYSVSRLKRETNFRDEMNAFIGLSL
jgi:hypothetical protein